MIRTQVVWEIDSLSASALAEMNAFVDNLVEQGKTDGISTKTKIETYVSIERLWVDRTTAQEWIDFVLQYNPALAEIIEDES
jgi:hypothetical protein